MNNPLSNVEEIISIFENKRPEVIFEWKDSETEAEGWVVINSLRGNASGGGTRMRKGLDQKEVVSLAKTMEVKFTISGPAIGGAKSGINFDPDDPRKEGVLKRWYKAVIPLLKYYYGTGGDLNVDEVKDVIPITSEFGLLHPQEGIVNGVFGRSSHEKIQRLQYGVSKIVTDFTYIPGIPSKLSVADLITGYGVSESVRHYGEIWSEGLKGKKAIIQGWGNVGAAAGLYLAKQGVKVVGIIDKKGGFINESGYSLKETEELLMQRNNIEKRDDFQDFHSIDNNIWKLGAEIFIPAAGSRLVTKDQLDQMINTGLKVIACGANVPFADKEIFMGPTLAYADAHVSVIPDFISNCGMARTFAFLMESSEEITDGSIFKDTSVTIKDALVELKGNCNKGKGLVAEGLRVALEKINRNEHISIAS